jgi:peroxiredoxin Q/BCP
MGVSRILWELAHIGRDKTMNIKEGDHFPYEELKTVEGGRPDLTGARKAVFYFYPKDDTPGCTVEAKEFTQLEKEFQSRGVRVFGVSADDAESHRAFCGKFGISFPLLIDEGGRLGGEIGNWRGSSHARTTVLTDGAGKVLKVYPEVKAQGHAALLLEEAGKT